MRKNFQFSIFNFQLQRGFTLIELLVVMAIIGVLSTLLMVNFIGIRQRARDGDRKSSIRQIQAALELYRSDQGAYPIETSSGGIWLTNDQSGSNPCTSTTAISLSAGTNVYMKKIPCDPSGTNWYANGNYYYISDGVTYTLAACLENTQDQSPEKTTTAPTPSSGNACSTGTYFVVYNP